MEYAERSHELLEIDHPIPLEIEQIEDLHATKNTSPSRQFVHDRSLAAWQGRSNSEVMETEERCSLTHPVREEVRLLAVPEQGELELLLTNSKTSWISAMSVSRFFLTEMGIHNGAPCG